MASPFPPLYPGQQPSAGPGAPPAQPLPPPGFAPHPPGFAPPGPYQQQQQRFAPKHRQRRTPEMLGYKPIDTLGTILIALFAIWMPLAIYRVTLALKERSLIHRYGLDPDKQPFVERNDLMDKVGLANTVYVALLLITGVVFLMWFAKAYGNLPTISPGKTERGTLFATLCWIIPLLSFVRPYGFLKEIWLRTEPIDSRRTSPLTLVITYWFCYAGATVIQIFIGQSFVGSVDDQKFGADLAVFESLVFVVTCVLAAAVVYKITQRMTHRCADVTQAVFNTSSF